MESTTLTLRPPVWALLTAVIIGGLFYLTGKNMEVRAPQQNPATISVYADAKVSAAPDIATLSFGVNTGRQPTAKAAIALVKKNMTAIIAAVKKAGIEEKDISTESFWLNPVYDYQNGTQIPRGFEANQSLSVKVRDLDIVGDVLTVATSAGANQAGGINFAIDNPDALNAEAREKAIKKAQAKAKVLADTLGMNLGRLTGFNEGMNYGGPVPMMAKGMGMGGGGMEADAGMAIPAGEQDIVSNVTLTYELR